MSLQKARGSTQGPPSRYGTNFKISPTKAIQQSIRALKDNKPPLLSKKFGADKIESNKISTHKGLESNQISTDKGLKAKDPVRPYKNTLPQQKVSSPQTFKRCRNDHVIVDESKISESKQTFVSDVQEAFKKVQSFAKNLISMKTLESRLKYLYDYVEKLEHCERLKTSTDLALVNPNRNENSYVLSGERSSKNVFDMIAYETRVESKAHSIRLYEKTEPSLNEFLDKDLNKTKLEQLTETHQVLKDEHSNLQLAYAAANEEEKRLKTIIDKLERELNDSLMNIQQVVSENHSVLTQHDQYKLRIKELLMEVKSLKSQLKEHEIHLDQQKDKLEKFKEVNSELRTKNEVAERTSANFQLTIEQLSASVQSYKLNEEDLKSQLKSLELDLQQKTTSLSESNLRLRNSFNEFEDSKSDLYQNFSRQIETSNSSKALLEEAKQEGIPNDKSSSIYKESKQSSVVDQINLSSINIEFSVPKVHQDIDKANMQLEQQEKIDQLEKSLNDIRTSVASASTTINQLALEKGTLNRTLRAEKNELLKLKNDHRDTIVQLQSQITDLQKLNSDLTAQKMISESSSVAAMSQQNQRQITKMNEELTNLRNAAKILEEQLIAKDIGALKANKRCSDITRELESENERALLLENHLIQLRTEVKQLQSLLSEVKLDLTRTIQEKTRLEATVTHLRAIARVECLQ